MNMLPIIAAALFLTLAGCAESGADGSLTYDGSANGSHDQSITCDNQGTIEGSGDVTVGQIRVTLTDSNGATLLDQTYNDRFTLAETTVSGSSGTWSLSAVRSSASLTGDSFSGNYEFHVNC
jgi:hypothetical protein